MTPDPRPETTAGAAPASRETLAAWLRLAITPGIGPVGGRQLVATCGGAREIWQSTPEQLGRSEGIGEAAIHALRNSPADAVEPLLQRCMVRGIEVLCPEDERYPESLRHIDDAPLVLFARGKTSALQHSRFLAVVGARKADSEGQLLTRRWCTELATSGIGIVSGMAYGIDAAAHGGALQAANGAPTIAVLGSGLAAPLSPQQQKQVAAIAVEGCVLSEFMPEEEARPEHFPRRNRIIAGLAAGTLIVQADIRSGSLITARLAAGYGREVMAVPGSVLSGRHAGCHQLLRDGATLVESPADILLAMGWQTDAGKPHTDYIPANETEEAILQALADGILHIDALAEQCGLTVSELSPILLGLELSGAVDTLPGSRFTLGRG